MNEIADDGLLPDNPCVMSGVGGTGGCLPQLDQIAVAADVLNQLLFIEIVGKRDGIGGLVLVEESSDRLVDFLMGEDVEIFKAAAQDVDDVGDDLVVAQ